METVGVIVVIILLVIGISLLGVVGKIIGFVMELFVDIVGDGLGACLGCIVWPIIILFAIGCLVAVL